MLMKILVVEDEEELATEICSYLSDMGNTCALAPDKFSAIDSMLICAINVTIISSSYFLQNSIVNLHLVNQKS